MSEILSHINDLLTRGASTALDHVLSDTYNQQLYPVVKLITQHATKGTWFNQIYLIISFITVTMTLA